MLLFLANLQMPKDDATQWVVLVVGMLATLWLIMRPKMKKKDPMEHRPSLSLSQQRQIERDMNALMVQMLDTARQMAAQLETRAAKLTALIADADRRLETLRQTTGQLPAAPEPTSTNPADAFADSTSSQETPPDPRHAEVYALADEGQSPNEIARSLGRPNGEVELILALRRH